ncbi:hypothetical protein [Parachryseolinea silvisoli]|jgi:hypothetical protein|uniref:hypothetical protein n=1 Tax=Parachryseolinea silvisoli TaxID=2873601 RepID=UPI002265A76A|nr:hypothetical protein [Parachryseolinea silvisoli]MCD9014042.1 hypothetical protein [Parachryseolinea silvisoli]
MAQVSEFAYRPDDYESEKASNSYLMSVVAVIAGLPLPIINLLATLFFYFGNRKGTFFVRWHCTQALLSQATVLCMNSAGFAWTMSIIFGDVTLTNPYIAYMITVVLFNISEFIATVYAAIVTRKGQHVSFWFFGPLTALICKD